MSGQEANGHRRGETVSFFLFLFVIVFFFFVIWTQTSEILGEVVFYGGRAASVSAARMNVASGFVDVVKSEHFDALLRLCRANSVLT